MFIVNNVVNILKHNDIYTFSEKYKLRCENKSKQNFMCQNYISRSNRIRSAKNLKAGRTYTK